MGDIKSQNQKISGNTGKKNTKKNTYVHYNETFKNQRERKMLKAAQKKDILYSTEKQLRIKSLIIGGKKIKARR